MPSPLDFIQTTAPPAPAGSRIELETKAAADESGTPTGEAFSAAFNQALNQVNSKLNKAEPSSPAGTEKPKDLSSGLDVERTGSGQAGQADPSGRKIGKKAEEDATIELAMAGGLNSPTLFSDDLQAPAEAISLLNEAGQSETQSISDESDPQTALMQDNSTRLALSVGFGTLSPDALLMMGLPPTLQAQGPITSVDLPPIPQPDSTVQTSLGIEPASSDSNPAARLNNPASVMQTGFTVASASPDTLDKQGPGFEQALQSAFPSQTQAAPVAQAGASPENRSAKSPDALAPSAAVEIPELPQTPGPISTPDASTASSPPQSNIQNPTQSIVLGTFEPATSPLTPSSPQMTPNTQTLATPFSLLAQGIDPAGQGLPAAFNGPSVKAAEDTLAASTPLSVPLDSFTQENASGSKGAGRMADSSSKTPSGNRSGSPMNELLKPMADLQESLSALNGTVESLSQDPDFESPQGLSEEPIFEMSGQAHLASDPLPSAALAGPLPGSAAIHQNPAANSPDKLPYFASLAENPVDQVVDGTVYSVKNGQKELILKINPDNLGEVRIRLTSLGNNEVSARLIASTQESHELLKTQSETLKASLEAQGIRIEKLSVLLAGHADNGANPNKQDQPSHFQQQSSNNAQAQPQSQQQAFQQSNQSFSPFFQANNGAYQNKQGFAQNPGGMNNGTGHGAEESSSRSAEPVRRNDNGHVSVLA
ncbi:flagellar hook-length control protein FliK [Vampirovibrio chlorellavorus]|uniref:flagellar hook-length control protein FliK n=1 Tax=Vampirovibrio chlorellavorus TaxID=758823 RepID=UPI0026F0038B|nr:flagellar hook-length control protein FliK [Vampirovibrio chlorellavorus]